LGESYDAVKRMAQCAMAGGAYAVADKYLNMLARTLFYRDFARRSKAAMADPHAMEREYGAVRKRRPVVEGDIFSHPLTPFRMLIQSPSGNPMALEYLTAWCLLDKRSIAEIASHIEDFKKAGYASLPIYCQEALLLLERQKKGGGLQGFRYDPAVAARVQGFFRDLLRYANQPEGPEQLRALYGDTYMFYCFCVTTPADIRPQIPEAGGAGAGYERE
jgi:hypothetical protein